MAKFVRFSLSLLNETMFEETPQIHFEMFQVQLLLNSVELLQYCHIIYIYICCL